ncbi:unnamed protein product [Effrenium voratum]|uniref:Uncharacterized protein n=1 Tax=Effrenium voratum TaxID=2562239 RepID=A0AA36MTU8_9DINO|nr:unnamed protein product [Effrenium voratum]
MLKWSSGRRRQQAFLTSTFCPTSRIARGPISRASEIISASRSLMPSSSALRRRIATGHRSSGSRLPSSIKTMLLAPTRARRPLSSTDRWLQPAKGASTSRGRLWRGGLLARGVAADLFAIAGGGGGPEPLSNLELRFDDLTSGLLVPVVGTKGQQERALFSGALGRSSKYQQFLK